jgi:hypothetical protein
MRTLLYQFSFLLLSLLSVQSCDQPTQPGSKQVFKTLSPAESGIDFNNALTVNDSMNYFTYGYFYMGGGVAVGDFNQDQKQDLYFTGNMVANKLYLNKGELQFEDITDKAGVAADDRWITGCAVIDINSDGLDDIYVSVAGKWKNRENILYVNKGLDENGIPVFEDMAEQYGLNDAGYSIQTAFFDYDNDGDLDVYVANYPPTPFNYTTREYKKLMDEPTWGNSDHLYKNNGDNTFSDVTEEAQVLRYGLSIGVVTNDFNNDGLTDLYVSNDFHTPDFFYLNNGDGTFKEVSEQTLQHTAFYGMGIDAADYNNDGLMDFMQLDMAAADHFRSKANMASMDPARFWNMVDNGFHYQYMYNVVQTSQGIRDDGLPFYAENAKLSGLHKTDWSWACLFADYDNDGYKDMFVTNGTRRDINNKDFFKWLERVDVNLKIKYKQLSVHQITERMPFKKLDNPIFKNIQGQKFKEVNKDWGIHYEGFSNGAAYADLDNDGDLELIINNIDTTAAIFKNFSVENGEHNFLSIQLNGPTDNPYGLGTKIWVNHNDHTQYHEHTLVRGYQSSVDKKIHFGLGETSIIVKVVIVWPDGKQQTLANPEINQKLIIDYKDAGASSEKKQKEKKVFTAIDFGPSFNHIENEFNDFDREVLLPHKMSAFGPAMAVGDVDKDGRDDIFVGGAKGQAPCLMYSNAPGVNYNDCINLEGEMHEDTDALFFDADGDGDLDLYVVSGGNEEEEGNEYYQDRIYENDGSGKFSLLSNCLPFNPASGSVVINADYDGDGDQDLFVGNRQIPGKYPSPANGFVLENVSSSSGIKFENLNENDSPDLKDLGMVTDAVWDDFDKDEDLDLIIVGEWMSITFLENDNNTFYKKEIQDFSEKTTGWWNTIEMADFDNDGDNDYILGNLGKNYKYKASQESSFDVYASDFDENGHLDIVLGYYQDGTQFPVRGKQCSSEQIPDLEKRFTNYNTFASADLSDIYSDSKLKKSLHYSATEFGHVYIENKGDGTFELKPLPLSTQIGTVNAMEVFDYNSDGNLDVVMGGNLMNSEVETPRSDACFGWLLLGDGKGGFQYQNYEKTGLYVPFETRKIRVINKDINPMLIFGNNNASLSVYEF